MREYTEQELFDYLSDLFWAAFAKAPVDTIYSLLRVSGMQDTDWDPFEESLAAFEDYNSIMRQSEDSLSQRGRWRIGLLMYCQAVEMTAPQEFLANLLRVLGGEQYHIKPFGSLGRANKKRPFSWVPPSAPVKYRELRRLALAAEQPFLVECIHGFFSEDIRNAFSHSDYVISPTHFRWTESGMARQISLETVNSTVKNCYRFFSVLLGLRDRALKDLRNWRRYHVWPNYEVFELLCDAESLRGFSVHFSNGNKATYSRTQAGVICNNLAFQRDGSINFFVGSLNELKPVWLVDGKPFEPPTST